MTAEQQNLEPDDMNARIRTPIRLSAEDWTARLFGAGNADVQPEADETS